MKKPRSDVIPLADRPTGSRFTWLYTQLRTAVLQGRLAPGSRMPSTRSLAATYGIARGTVVEVFEQLSAEGYLHGKSGSGTFVATSLPDEWTRVSAGPSVPILRRAMPRPTLSERGQILCASEEFVPGSRPRAFQAHRPAVDRTTVALWQRISSRRRVRDLAYFSHNDRRGYRPLRAAVADYLRRVRGVRCDENRVLIFSGVQPALDLTTRLLADPGDAALIEDPGYSGIRAICRANGLHVRSLPVDAEGADIEAVESNDAARLAYVTPAHQFPLGMALSVRRRLALLTWASRGGGYIFEDDYDGEYRFAGRPIAALQGLDENQCVIYSGTFNKVLFPSLRLSYLVVPDHLVDAFASARSTIDRYPALAPQMVLCDFITEGHFARHLRRMRELYAERLAFFQQIVERSLGDELELDPVSTGLQVVAWLRSGRCDATLARAASARDVEVLPLSATRMQRPLRDGLVLGFAGFERAETLRGVDGLRGAINELQPAALAR